MDSYLFSNSIPILSFDTSLDFPIMFGINDDLECASELMIEERQQTYVMQSHAAVDLLSENGSTLEQFDYAMETTDVKKSKKVFETVVDTIQKLNIPLLQSLQNVTTKSVQQNIDSSIVDYNTQTAINRRNSSKKFTSKNRILDIFFPKFKQFLKKYLLKHYPVLNKHPIQFRAQLNNLPGMKKTKNMKMLIELFRTKRILGIPVSLCDCAIEYLGSNSSLLDALYPLQNKNGALRTNRLGDKSTWDIIDYLPIYEMMVKVQKEQKTVNDSEQSFQNLWYYSHTTAQVYEQFDLTG